MAGSQFSLTAAELNRFSDEMASTTTTIQAELRRLEGVVASVTKGWRGEAAVSYQHLQHRWNQDAAVLNRVLGEIRQSIDASTRRYVVTEEDQRARLTGIKAALG